MLTFQIAVHGFCGQFYHKDPEGNSEQSRSLSVTMGPTVFSCTHTLALTGKSVSEQRSLRFPLPAVSQESFPNVLYLPTVLIRIPNKGCFLNLILKKCLSIL